MFDFIKNIFKDPCQHPEWLEKGGKRFCKHCDEEQWLFVKRYPQVGEPKMTWQTMRRKKKWI